ncbi:facilitated trehalose transporter Tret1-like [Diabrotica virgifera virgifera]|uniref:Facilitated trehalose transporter Tret1-like n=1 Tax=Diabrotica virgifera virgifera TaxID=50390 RepID=A0A6P7G6I6_DIAVI|nr:facilitated trehalose transporter Tret1-like [Diabrotica virgifera virgifera]
MTVLAYENLFKGTLFQLLAVLSGTLNAISDGMQYGWTAPVLPILLGPDSPVPITEWEGEMLETFLWVGSLSCLPLTMYLVDKIGRKNSILLAAVLTLTVWVITALAPSVEYLYVARFLAGTASNTAYVSTPMYIAEIAEQKIRGFLSSLIYLMMLLGIFLIYAVAPYIPYYAHCTLGAILACLELGIFPFMPESPYFLVFKGKHEEAKKSLEWLRPEGADVETELNEINAAIERQKTEKDKIWDLFIVPSYRKGIIIMFVLNGAQHFSSISVLLMNLHIILEAAGSTYIDPATAGILFAFILLLAATVASVSVDKYGRRTLLISSSLLTGICLFILAVYFTVKNSGYDTASVSWIPIVCIMVYACVFKLGLGLVPIVLAPELFPANVKGYGMTLVDATYVIASLLSLQIYQRLADNFGLEYPFYVFSISCIFTAIFSYFVVPETKGKSLEEIQMILKGNNKEKEKEKDIENTRV